FKAAPLSAVGTLRSITPHRPPATNGLDGGGRFQIRGAISKPLVTREPFADIFGTVGLLATVNFLGVGLPFGENQHLFGRKAVTPCSATGSNVSCWTIHNNVLNLAKADVEEVGTHAHQVAGHDVVFHLVGVVPADEAARDSDTVKFVCNPGEQFPGHVVFTLLAVVVEDAVPRRAGHGQVDGVAGEFGQPFSAVTVPDFVVKL